MLDHVQRIVDIVVVRVRHGQIVLPITAESATSGHARCWCANRDLFLRTISVSGSAQLQIASASDRRNVIAVRSLREAVRSLPSERLLAVVSIDIVFLSGQSDP